MHDKNVFTAFDWGKITIDIKKKYISDEIYTKLDRNDTDMIDSIWLSL